MEKNRQMRILVLSSEVWNDKINGNNVTSNWFEGMDAKFANVYCEPGAPYNNCCEIYFQITDKMMAKSIIGGKKAGRRLDTVEDQNNGYKVMAEKKPVRLYSFLKSISGDCLRLLREIIWLIGKYNIDELKTFIDDFDPDIIFSERMASCKMLRLEKMILKLSNAPIVAFTGDDEYSLRQFKISPFYWINRFMVRRRLREMVTAYKIYYTLSREQLEEYESIFPCEIKILRKCGEIDAGYTPEDVISKPIRIIYAGKLYMNRWKALADISECISKINKNGQQMILEIYTKDKITNKQKTLLDDGMNSVIKGAVSQEELSGIYRKADLALHVESQKLQQKLLTRLSFSTKIIDCLFSGCGVIAYCWRKQSGWTYLKAEDAAICVDRKEELLRWLQNINNNPEIINEYKRKAYECCKKNHLRQNVQKGLIRDFRKVIENG